MLIRQIFLSTVILLLSCVSVAQADDRQAESQKVVDRPFAMSQAADRPLPKGMAPTSHLAIKQAADRTHTRRHTSTSSLAGFYLGILAGSTYPMDTDNGSDRPRVGALAPAESSFDPGYTVSALLGYEFAPMHRAHSASNVRLEVELGFNEADIDEGRGNPEAQVSTLMANLYYDLDTGTRWEPFVGAGVGGARYEADGANLGDDDDTVFAYQARAGIGYNLTSSTTATLEYRFLDTLDPELETRAGRSFETEYRSHSIEFGLRYAF